MPEYRVSFSVAQLAGSMHSNTPEGALEKLRYWLFNPPMLPGEKLTIECLPDTEESGL